MLLFKNIESPKKTRPSDTINSLDNAGLIYFWWLKNQGRLNFSGN